MAPPLETWVPGVTYHITNVSTQGQIVTVQQKNGTAKLAIFAKDDARAQSASVSTKWFIESVGSNVNVWSVVNGTAYYMSDSNTIGNSPVECTLSPINGRQDTYLIIPHCKVNTMFAYIDDGDPIDVDIPTLAEKDSTVPTQQWVIVTAS